MLEVWAGGFGVVGEGWDGHESADFEVEERLQGCEKGGEFGWGEAVLGVLVRELDLDEHAEGFVKGLGGGVEAFGGFEGVESVDGVEDLGRFGGLVVLEWADEVDLRGGEEIGEGCALGLPLLDAVFAEESLAGFEGFKESLGGLDFADGHECDGVGGTVGAGAGVADFIMYAGEI